MEQWQELGVEAEVVLDLLIELYLVDDFSHCHSLFKVDEVVDG